MLPILFSIGPFHLYSFSVFLILSWFVWSFVFWRHMRERALDEEFTFNLMFWATLLAFIFGRSVYVISNWQLFSETFLRVFTIWIEPGFSLMGALVGCIGAILFLSYQQKLPRSYALDGVIKGFAFAFLVGCVGALLDGGAVGIVTGGPIGVHFVGHEGLRHPIQLYAFLCVIFTLGILRVFKKLWHLDTPGFFGLWFLFFFTIDIFCVEFFKESSVYFAHLTFNQWLCVVIWAEAVGMLYVRGGGKELVRRIYVGISKRFTRKHTNKS